jgi:hypothetical protein
MTTEPTWQHFHNRRRTTMTTKTEQRCCHPGCTAPGAIYVSPFKGRDPESADGLPPALAAFDARCL